MTSSEQGWLQVVISDAEEAGWCTKPFCTTCGSGEFREAYWTAAARHAGLELHLERGGLPRRLLAGTTNTERDLIVRTLVAGLRQLPRRLAYSDAVSTILGDLDPPLVRHGVPISLGDILSDTPVGEALHERQAHAREVAMRRLRREEFESPEATRERRERKRAEKAKAHARRQAAKRQRDRIRAETLKQLANLSPKERIARFATDSELNLDTVPEELIPVEEVTRIPLDESIVEKLIARIDRRKGGWGRLRRVLEGRTS